MMFGETEKRFSSFVFSEHFPPFVEIMLIDRNILIRDGSFYKLAEDFSPTGEEMLLTIESLDAALEQLCYEQGVFFSIGGPHLQTDSVSKFSLDVGKIEDKVILAGGETEEELDNLAREYGFTEFMKMPAGAFTGPWVNQNTTLRLSGGDSIVQAMLSAFMHISSRVSEEREDDEQVEFVSIDKEEISATEEYSRDD
jgi:hypothetical protein